MSKIHELGKGALPDIPDVRDYKVEQKFGAVMPDWTKPTNLVPVGRRNQGSSSSCTGQATSYLHDLKAPNADIFSARDIYAQIFQPGGGAYIRDAVLFVVKKGHARRSEVPEPEPQTESSMTSLADITPAKELDDRESDAYVLPQNNIDYTAWAIQNFGGVVLGVNGTNEGWANHEFPRPPKAGDGTVWGHALCALDVAVINGKKFIKCASSWSETNQEYHYLGEDYFSSNNVFNPWVIIPRKMTNVQFVHKTGTSEYGFYVPALSEDALKDKALNFNVALTNSTGGVDFTKAVEVSGLK